MKSSLQNRKAFTLIELLVVIAIIAILAAILFPVFAQAKAAAKKAVSISNFKQVTLAEIMYQTDVDDRFVISSYNETFQAAVQPYDSNSQLLLKPYMKTEGILFDPMDPAQLVERETAGGDLANPQSYPPGPIRQQVHDLNVGFTSDWGINYDFLQPVFQTPAGVQVTAISLTSVNDPGNTIMAIDSIWGRRASGTPYGAGNYGVDAPCVYDANGVFSEPGYVSGDGVWWFGGWSPNQPLAWNVFGGVRPWHGTKCVVAWVDGHAKVLDIATVGQGCNVQPGWGGRMTDSTKYYWDLN